MPCPSRSRSQVRDEASRLKIAGTGSGVSARAPHALRAEVLWTLWLLPLLFAGRVLGQVVAGTLAPSWLPPFEQWDSHTLPYPVLFAGQLVLLGLQGKLALDATHRRPVLRAATPMASDGVWCSDCPRGRSRFPASALRVGARRTTLEDTQGGSP